MTPTVTAPNRPNSPNQTNRPALAPAYPGTSPVSENAEEEDDAYGAGQHDPAIAFDLSNEEKKELGERLHDLISQGRAARIAGGRDALVTRWRRAYKMAPPARVLPFRGAANYHTVMTRSIVDTLHARSLRVTTGIRPFLKVKAQASRYKLQAQRIEQFVHALLEGPMDFRGSQDRVLLKGYIDGWVAIKPCWRKETRLERDLVPLTPDLLAEMGYQYKGAVALKDGDAVMMGGKKRIIGRAYDLVRPNVTYNAPRFEVIDYMDWVMNPASAKKIESATLCGYQVFKTVPDVWDGVTDGLYDEDAVERMLRHGPSAADRGDPQVDPDADRDDAAGISRENEGDLEAGGHLQIFEVLYKYDPVAEQEARRREERGGSRQDEKPIRKRARWCVFRVEMSTKTLLAAQPFPYWHGEPYFIPFVPFLDPDGFYGYSLPQILDGPQRQDNALANQLEDAGTIALSFKIERERDARTSILDTPFTPGVEEVIVDSFGKFQVHNFAAPVQTSMGNRAFIHQEAEKATAASEAQMGLQPTQERTASENSQVLAQGSLRLDVPVGRIQASNTHAFRQVLRLCRQYCDPETEFLLAGGDYDPKNPRFGTITREDLQSNVQVEAYGDTINTDRALELQGAEKVLLFSERSTFAQENAVRVWEAQAYFLNAHGISNYTDFIGTREEAEQTQAGLAKAKESAPNLPNLPPNVNEEWMALFLAQNPPLATPYLQSLAGIAQAQSAGDSQQGEDAALQAQQAEQEMAISHARMTVEAARVQAEEARKDEEHAQTVQHREEEHDQQIAHRDEAHRQSIAETVATGDTKRLVAELSAEQQKKIADEKAAAIKRQAAAKPRPGGNGAAKKS